MTNHQMTLDDFIPQRLAIKAMRDSGYKNTAYALAELIDNSVQAESNNIELLCEEATDMVNERVRSRVSRIAVLDDGYGMDVSTLSMCLQFGNGTHLEDRSGIGRFGMGLPNSSISQCGRVTVWSWQTGVDNAFFTYLDVDEIISETLRSVPQPVQEPLPDEWRNKLNHLNTSGTLVIWEKLEYGRLTWRTSESILSHLEDFSGRIYRKFLSSGELGLHLSIIDSGGQKHSREARVNDPLYLMTPTYTPKPFDETPMFQSYGSDSDDDELEKLFIEWNNATYEVVVRASYATEATNDEKAGSRDRGSTIYGQHAKKNQGISILRARRELELDLTWTERRATRDIDRWWGIEVEFPPELDEVFGVTNNKQAATIFSGMSDYDFKSETQPNESYVQFVDRLKEEGDPRGSLLELVVYLQTRLIPQLRRKVDQQNVNTRGPRHATGQAIDDVATTKINDDIKDGKKAPLDDVPFDDKAEKEFAAVLVGQDIPESEAKEIAAEVRKKGRRMLFVEAYEDNPAFFTIGPPAGNLIEVIFNKNHPVFERLFQVLDSDTSTSTDAELVERIENASDTLKLLFGSFARWELLDGPNRTQIQQMRWDWGIVASKWIKEDD